MQFNYSYQSNDNSRINPDPQYRNAQRHQAWTEPGATPSAHPGVPPIQAPTNIGYLGFIDLVHFLWNKAHPEIKFTAYADNNVYEPEMGYIVYSLVNREPKQGNPKPRYKETVDNQSDATKQIAIFTQSFINSVRFTALHKYPRIAEEIVEAFEDFMIEHTPIFKRMGLEELQYGRRASDEHKTRFGEDLAARSIIYVVGIQKILMADINKLDRVWLEFITYGQGATPTSVIQIPIP